MVDDIVRGYVVAASETARAAGRLERFADEVGVFAAAVHGSDALRLTLADAALSAIERSGVVADLLDDRSLEETSAVARFVVRVVRAAEVPAAIGEVASFVEELSVEEGPLDVAAPAGRSGARLRLRGYAERVLEELEEPAALDGVEDDAFRFARVLESNPELRRTLEDTNFAVTARVALCEDLLGADAHATVLRLMAYVLRAGRLRNLVGTFDWLVELVAEERGRRVAEVRSALDLTDEERGRLAAALRRLVGREVEVRVVIDPSVIGGVLVATGDLFIDGTVRLRFERMRDAFVLQA